MAGEYTVKILSSEDFNKLPFKRIQEDPDNIFGAADVKTKTAYIRDTGYNDFTKATIDHELDELMAQTSPHEVDGIRYKDFGSIFQGIGNLGKSAVGAVGSGIGAIGRGVKNIFTPGPAAPIATGPGGRLITGATQAATPAALPALTNNPATGSPFTGGAGTAAAFAKAAGSSPSLAAGAQQQVPQQGGNWLTNMFKGAGSAFNSGIAGQGVQGSGPATGENVSSTTVQPTFMQQLFNTAGKNAPSAVGGTAVSMLGDLFSKTPPPIDVSGITGALKDRVSGANPSDLYQAGSAELMSKLGTTPDAPPESAFVRGDQVIDQELTDRLKNLEQQFKAATGNADVSNNSAYLREVQRIQQESAEKRAAVRDEISFQFTREQLARDLQEVELALNLDKSQTEQMIRIAQLDAEAIAVNYNLDLREAQDFKNLFGNFGQLLFRDTPQATAPTTATV